MKVVKYVLAIICFGIGVAFAIGAIQTMQNPYSGDAWIPGMFAGMFLLGTFLLLRRT